MPELNVQLRSYGDQLLEAADPVTTAEAQQRSAGRRHPSGPVLVVAALLVALAAISTLVILHSRTGGAPTKVSSTPTAVAAPTIPAWSPRLDWSQTPVDARTFPLGTQITSLVSFKGRLIAAGRVELAQCSTNTQAFCDATNTGLRAASMVIWASTPDGADWTRVWDSADPDPLPGTIILTPTLVATNGAVYLVGTTNGRRFNVAGQVHPGDPLHYSGLPMLRSASGLDWSPVAIPNAKTLVAEGATGRGARLVVATLPYANGLGDQISTYTTENGTDWSSSTDGLPVAGGEISAMTAGAGGFVLGGYDGPPAIWTSPDAVHWQEHKLPTADGIVRGVGEDGSLLIALTSRGGGGDTSTIWHSSDGQTWIPASTSGELPPNAGPAAIIATSTDMVLFGGTSQGTHGVWVSPDGLTWTSAINSGTPREIGPSDSGAALVTDDQIVLFTDVPGGVSVKPTDPGVQFWHIRPAPQQP